MNTSLIILNILIMAFFIFIIYKMQKKHVSFSKRVFLALGLGIVFGAVLQFIYGSDSEVLKQSVNWFNIVGNGYVRLLKMIVMPLIMVSITTAIINLEDGKSLGKFGGYVIGFLVLTAGIAAVVGVFTAVSFGLSAEGLQAGQAELARGEVLQSGLENLNKVPLTQRLTELIPDNPFLDMTGARSSSTIAVVIFSTFVGISVLGLKRKKPDIAEKFRVGFNVLHDVVMRMVTIILRLTPFGVLALMTKVTALSDYQSIVRLGKFVLASYVAIIIMFIIHLIFLMIFGLNPKHYLKKSLPVLTFAFTSRTSAGTIPLNIEAQTKKLGVSEAIANLSASFGASIGQNGCAAIYPAMLAVMIAPTQGINPLNPSFLIPLIVIIVISSFGVAGVGGGATFAALIVLSAMDLPVALVGLLISIEPLIDMGRTALNVSGSMLSGILSSRVLKQLDLDLYNKEVIEEDV
ncbi:hypothetical protein C7380_11033 [Oceanotoga teriensis]|jgi:hypothetical protein|uniref:L-cystine transporter n=1 Tax=Oceanotoga teriensis TaxID=515440 RepID=A0AA45C6E2_9BACT|nr:L-cystine transporter [Oceanotoga teriensis]PWJ92040.1 hypothetical protein C7380_11033 [Oceanotoga teriensis]